MGGGAPQMGDAMDRRRQIYKNMRNEIIEADKSAKEKAIAEKMKQMEIKTQQREQERR